MRFPWPKFVLLLCFWAPIVLEAQDADTVRITHRFDWRRSIDQKYQGLVYGYATGSWKLRPAAGGWTDVEARYYQASESRRNNTLTEKPIEGEQIARFRIDPLGNMSDFTGDGVPYYRNYPAPLPPDAVPGSTWTGQGELVGDFLGTGTTTSIPILIEYRWEGPGKYGETPVIQVRTQYALRYQAGSSRRGDPVLSRVDGSHTGMVSYDESSHKVVFIRETAKEVFLTTAGRQIANDGILLTFFEGVPALGTATLVKNLNQALGRTPPTDQPKSLLPGASAVRAPSDLPDVKIEEDPRGVKLTLENLKFVADQAILLPGEDLRFARIAELLRSVPNRNLLVIGHTAAIGTIESQDSLSLERALSIVNKLKAAGIPAQRLLYEGRGGREPLAPNTTEVGKAQNRRVEVVILDQ